MDHQGAGRTRSAADTRRQPPWQSMEGVGGPGDPEGRGAENTGPIPARSPGFGTTASGTVYGATAYGASGSGAQRVLGPGTGPQRLIAPGTGPQQLIGPGTGPQRLIASGSGPQQVLSPGSGPQPTFGAPDQPPGAWSTGSWERTPVRDVPPGREPTEPSLGGPAEDAASGDDTYLVGPLVPADGAGRAAAPGRRRGGRTKRRFRSRSWLAAAVVVVAAVGIAGYKFLYEPRVNAPVPPTLRLPTTAPGSPGSPGYDKTLGKWQHIGTRAEDPQQLTITGLYPPQFVLGGSSYVRTAASVTKTCSLAVYGADLQAALQSGHCTQVLRASYISGDGKMMGTVGVVNLITSSAAQKAGQVTGPQEIIAPLAGKKGATSKLGNGTGVVQAEIKGHYLILMWAEFTSLKSPSGQAQRQALEQFAANLVTGSANINLSTRMLTGKP